jgi:DNA-3-methyladenine glycosylase II
MASRRSTRLSGGLVSSANHNDSPATSKKRKTVKEGKMDAIDKDGFAIPSTPKRKKTVRAAPTSTPTPSAAKLMGQPSKSGEIIGDIASANRIADPYTTNAPLISPGTSRVLANKAINATSPTKPPQSKTTTANILVQACAHLVKIEPRMKTLIDKHHCALFSPEGLAEQIDPFSALCSGIISQQVSGAAARSIKAKFISLFNSDSVFPSPSAVAAMDIATLRTAGLSQRKAEYIKGLAEKFAGGELSTQMLMEADYEEVLEKLIAVRGLGRWSVEMFACFGLKRMDVFSTGDLGVQYVLREVIY